MISQRLAECQRVIGYHFTDAHQLEIALTHSSVRTPDRECNERLEFLGDSVLGLAITDELYKRLPDQAEGELTRIKSAVVSRGALYRVSTRLGLVRFIEVAKGVGRREELPVSLTANLVESIIGAIYLDAGFFPAREFILRHLGPELEDVFNDRVAKNYKSLLQHDAQERMGVTPVYRTIEAEGPDHRRNFTVAAMLRGTEYGRASGINKKEAEQEAARHALEALQRSGRGRRRRSDGRDDARPDVRPDHRPEARGSASDRSAFDRAGPSDRPTLVDRTAIPERGTTADRSTARAPRDDDAWKRWAETGSPAGSTPVVAAPFGSKIESYSVGPEADDGWDDASPPVRPPTPMFHDAVAETLPIIEPLSQPTSDPASTEGAGIDDKSEPRGRRRRRGGRGRGRSPSLDDGVLGPVDPPVAEASRAGVVHPANSSLASVFTDAGPADAPSQPSSVQAAEDLVTDSTPAADPTAARPRSPRTRTPARSRPRSAPNPARDSVAAEAGAPAVEVPVASTPPALAPTPKARTRPLAPPVKSPLKPPVAPAEKTPAAQAAFEFGKGVSPAAPPPAKPVERAVTDVGSVDAVKAAPPVRKPPSRGGFGEGL